MHITRPETELLLGCVSPARIEERGARIRQLLDSQLDWNYLENLANSHGLLPLLYWGLNSAAPEAVPSSMAEKFQHNTRNSLFLTGELFRILDLFEREGIAAIPFKGPTLAISAYNNLALRSFNDLDILIHPEDVWRTRDLLLGAGYTTKLRLKKGRENAYTRSYDELVLYGPSEYPLIELHWAFVPPHFSVALDLPPLWDRTIQLNLGNRTVPSLSPPDLFLVLCLHGSKHCWSHLGLVCDVAWLITTHSLSWESVLDRARELGIHRMTLLACLLAWRVLELPLDEAVARDVAADPGAGVLAEQITKALFGMRHDETAIVPTSLLHVRMRERWSDRFRYTFRLGARPAIEDWQWIDLPRPLSFLYPVLRFPRLILKHWSRVP